MTSCRTVFRSFAPLLRIAAACACLLATTLPAVCAADVAPPTIPDAVLESIRQRVDLKYNPGIVVGLVGPGGATYFGYGTTALSGGERPDENTVFEIGSITKVFTAIVLAHMAEQGKLALEDPLARHLPETVRVPELGGPIRLVDLATHRSSLPRLPGNVEREDPYNPYADYTIEQAYEFLSRYELPREVGEQYVYSNYGMGLLGHVLARRAGVTYETLVRDTITSKLGMADTAVTLSESMRRRLARPHSSTTEVKNWDILALGGAGALRSTAADMVRFLRANMGLRKTDLHSAMVATHAPRAAAGDPNAKVGLGWHLVQSGEVEIVCHDGATGGYKSLAGFVRGGDLGVVVLTNSGTGEVSDIGFHLLGGDAPLFRHKPRRKLPLFKKD